MKVRVVQSGHCVYDSGLDKRPQTPGIAFYCLYMFKTLYHSMYHFASRWRNIPKP
jgi:hypothetical protein